MKKLFVIAAAMAFFFLALHSAWAQEAAEAAKDTSASNFADDVKKAREILLGDASDNLFGRGMMVALFQPVFLCSMFCMGLWAGQLSDKLKAVWALPLLVFGATVLAAFLTTYHADWTPDLENGALKSLSHFKSTDAVAVAVGLIFGAVVGMNFLMPPVFAFAVAIVAGLALGFSQTGELGGHDNALLPFWAGFGLTGFLVNIFGLGFETFLQSIALNAVTRAAGLATLVLSFFFGTKVF